MKKVFLFVFVFVLVMGFCFAADDWGDINAEDSEAGEDLAIEGQGIRGEVSGVNDESQVSGDGKFFTKEFYIALGLGFFILIIIGVFVWLWLRGPKNKWE